MMLPGEFRDSPWGPRNRYLDLLVVMMISDGCPTLALPHPHWRHFVYYRWMINCYAQSPGFKMKLSAIYSKHCRLPRHYPGPWNAQSDVVAPLFYVVLFSYSIISGLRDQVNPAAKTTAMRGNRSEDQPLVRNNIWWLSKLNHSQSTTPFFAQNVWKKLQKQS